MNITKTTLAATIIMTSIFTVGCESSTETGLNISNSSNQIAIRTNNLDDGKVRAYEEGRIQNAFALAVNTRGIKRANFAVREGDQVVLISEPVKTERPAYAMKN